MEEQLNNQIQFTFNTKEIPFMTVKQLEELRSLLWKAGDQTKDAIGFLSVHGSNPEITYARDDENTGGQ